MKKNSMPLTAMLWVWVPIFLSEQAQAAQAEILAIRIAPHLTISAPVGSSNAIYYSDASGNLTNWQWLTNVWVTGDPYEFTDPSINPPASRFYTVHVITPPNPNPGRLAWIPPGSFVMGSPSNELERGSNEGPQTTVHISKGFFMSRYEITQGEYLSVMGNNPSYYTGVTNMPVDTVSYVDATNYCYRRTGIETSAGRLPLGWRYRLPTEAEWEYACRAGTTTPFHYGPDLKGGMANFYCYYEYFGSIGSVYVTSPVGYIGRTSLGGNYQANTWGLCDMHGNLWEWCSDWYSDALPGGVLTDPQGPASGANRVLRSGGFGRHGSDCRSAFRNSHSPSSGNNYMGLRIVLAENNP